MIRLAIIFIAVFSLQPFAVFAEELPECTERDFSRKTKRQVSDWHDNSYLRYKVDEVVAEVDEALLSKEYSACDKLYIEITRLRIAAKSQEPEVAIPILRYFIENTTQETNQEWSKHVSQLSRNYRKTKDLDALHQLSLKYLPILEDGEDKQTLEYSLALAKAGFGQIEDAQAILESNLDTFFDEFEFRRLNLLYALALRTNDSVLAEQIPILAEERFGGFYPPKPLPYKEGDMLDRILDGALGPGLYQDVKPLNSPTPTYPRNAAEAGIEGECEVIFDVDVSGHPKNIEAICSHKAFINTARKSVEVLRFTPHVIDGEAREMTYVVYPIQFRLG